MVAHCSLVFAKVALTDCQLSALCLGVCVHLFNWVRLVMRRCWVGLFLLLRRKIGTQVCVFAACLEVSGVMACWVMYYCNVWCRL